MENINGGMWERMKKTFKNTYKEESLEN